jgi:formamidopyrimidine-DNA glycosylase
MPELPEVETVKNTLKKQILGKRIQNIKVLYDGIIETDKNEFKNIINEEIIDIKRRGKFLIFVLNNYYLVSHLRMEGKYFIKNNTMPIIKHEHIIFDLGDCELRYHDTRKFGKMYLVKKDKLFTDTPLSKLGLEPWDNSLTCDYLKEKMNSHLPVKTLLLDQSIITGIGNIYADEILFLSRINPLTKSKDLTDKNRKDIIANTIKVLDKAIEEGGTTIRSYTSEEGVTGLFQNNLCVHQREKEECRVCKTPIIKIKVGGRGTYYCPKCQKKRS